MISAVKKISSDITGGDGSMSACARVSAHECLCVSERKGSQERPL
jgi:hypothetical protein